MGIVLALIMLCILGFYIYIQVDIRKQLEKEREEARQKKQGIVKSRFVPVNMLSTTPTGTTSTTIINTASRDYICQLVQSSYNAREYSISTGWTSELDNVPIMKTPVVGYFVDDRVKDLKISPAEQLIIEQLSRYRVKWVREVSFPDLQLATGGYARYDFLLPDHRIVIEYHGKMWHCTPEKKIVDNLKEVYCVRNGIEYIEYNSKHYYHIEHEIKELMERLQVRLR